MNGGRFGPSAACNTNPQSALWLTVRIIALFLLPIAFLGLPGCARNESVEKPGSRTTIEAPAQQPPPEPDQLGADLPAVPHLVEGSGIAVWAKEFDGELIAGLDDALYEPYLPATVEQVQKALRDRGLYAGPLNGVLDRPTMKSIYAFQEANKNLQRCGVPTPYTRKMLEQGSHTDVS